MESKDLGTLIVGAICGIGMIELIMWTLTVFRHPGYDYLRPELAHKATSTPREESETSRTVRP